MGHKANICSLDFHPYGEFVASGSQDTNIKVRYHSAYVKCKGILPPQQHPWDRGPMDLARHFNLGCPAWANLPAFLSGAVMTQTYRVLSAQNCSVPLWLNLQGYHNLS